MEKKSFGKRFAATLAGILLGFAAFAPALNVRKASAAEPTPIDMFLIAGQSNAAGYSAYSSSDSFGNVMYGGEVDANYVNGTAAQSLLTFDKFKTKITTGLGRAGGFIGPEFGMAEVLSEYYTADSPAFIFKSAAGGTSLLDTLPSGTSTYGNWYPKSRWSANKAVTTGMQYENFVENFQTVYNELTAHGYAPRVRAMIWMQGEADVGAYSTYASLLKTFIADIRSDLVDITGDLTLSLMPFIIGEIAETFGSYKNIDANKRLIEAQRQVANEAEEVYTVATYDLPINKEGTNGSNVVLGYDQYHFNGPDARTLGNRFANAALETLSGARIRIRTSGSGSGTATYRIEQDGSITITVTPAADNRLKTLRVNGVDVTSEVVDNQYTILDPAEYVEIEVAFVKPMVFEITYRYDEEAVTVTGPSTMREGDALSVTVTANEGYEIVSVVFVGNAAFRVNDMTKNGDEYNLSSISRSGMVKVVSQRVGEGQGGGDQGGANAETPSNRTGRILLIVGLSVLGVGIIAAVVVVVILRRKKHAK